MMGASGAIAEMDVSAASGASAVLFEGILCPLWSNRLACAVPKARDESACSPCPLISLDRAIWKRSVVFLAGFRLPTRPVDPHVVIFMLFAPYPIPVRAHCVGSECQPRVCARERIKCVRTGALIACP